MKTIFEDEFVALFYDENKKLFMNKWFAKSVEIDVDNIKAEFINAAKLIELYKPKFYIADNKEQGFIFNVDIQEWCAETIFHSMC